MLFDLQEAISTLTMLLKVSYEKNFEQYETL